MEISKVNSSRNVVGRPKQPKKLWDSLRVAKTSTTQSTNTPRRTKSKEFAGFGAAPPKRSQRRHMPFLTTPPPSSSSSSSSSSTPNKDNHDHKNKKKDLLLKDAEKLIQIMLGDDKQNLSTESIEKAIQQQRQQQQQLQHQKSTASSSSTSTCSAKTKARYNSLLQKPWRTTPSPSSYHENGESSESGVDERLTKLESANPKSFRRSSMSDVGSSEAAKESMVSYSHTSIKAAKESLLKTSSALGGAADESNTEDSSEEFSVYSSSEQHNSNNHSSSSSNNNGTGDDAANLQVVTAQLADSQKQLQSAQQSVQKLREKLSIVMMNADPDESNAILSVSANDDNDSDGSDAVAELLNSVGSFNNTTSSKQQQQRIQELEALVESSQKAQDELKVQNIELQDQLEQQQEQAEKQARLEAEKQMDALKINVAVANANAEMAQRKFAELQAEHDCYRAESAAQSKVDKEKMALLHTELSNLVPLTTEMSQIKLHLHTAETKLKKSQDAMDSLQETADLALTDKKNLEQEFAKLQNESASRIANLEQNLLVAKNNGNNNIASSSEQQQQQLQKELASVRQKLQQSEQTIEQLQDTSKATAVAAAAQMASLEQCLKDTKERTFHLENAQKNEQEILSEELRESETTIACLMDELDALKPLATELEHAEQELQEVRRKLKEATDEVDEAKATATVSSSSPKAQVVDDHQSLDEAALLECERKLAETTNCLKKAEQTIHTMENDHKADLAILEEKLKVAKDHSASLEQELVKANSVELQCTVTCAKETKRLEQLLERKDKEIESLKIEIDEQQKQIMTCRLQVEEMDEERNFNRAKMTELSRLVDIRNRTEPEKRLLDKTVQCAELTAERDTLKQKLNVVEAMACTLEQDNKQKKELVHELMSRGGDASSSTEAFIESLQNEQERTLKRTAQLSLQLAESQLKIDQLTSRLRRAAKKPQPPLSRQSALPSLDLSLQGTSGRRGANRRSLSNMLNDGLDRVNNALDASGREVPDIGDGLRRWSSKISNAYDYRTSNSSSRTLATTT